MWQDTISWEQCHSWLLENSQRERKGELNDIDEKLTSWYIYIELCQASSNWGVLTGSEAVRK